ncbi:MAG: hypothetical protein QNL14_15740 [Deltaproteobacteria bacterium]|nr:hypothetical protein [Deltaproteobacteria bacterium]
MIDCSQITMYSGGHRGSEAEFGKTAERWGIKEVNFSFEGHNIERERGVQVLGPDELDNGDVSMEIVSLRMGRTYAKTAKIRQVIQSIFHMVNKGYHVITIGWIQPDNTVKGGTGWGVELAKLFNRPVHVYDQDKKEWSAWQNNRWVAEVPVITDTTMACTGTRNLDAEGARAIHDLFERSFGPAA